MKTRALSKDDRKSQILLAFAVNIQSGGTGQLTSVEVAHKIGLVPSKHVRDFLKELVIEGLLQSKKESMTGAVGCRWIYSPTGAFDARTGHPKREPRTISIKTHKNGKLALFSEVFS